MHEDPQVPNYGRKGSGKVLKDGIVLAIEPMINLGTHEVIFHKDGWTVTSKDNSPSAHFEPVSYTHLDVYKRQTEEALPSYESWIMGIDGVEQENRTGWSQWVRSWTAEENRHGDLLNKYLYLCGRVNMREIEITTQYLIQDGFDLGTSMDPYRNFVYTSFQETATNISHRRVGTLAKQTGNTKLAKMCGVIAADEARHAKAYKHFVSRIFELDPSEMMLAFEDMMKKKIVMPAHLMRESGQKAG